MSIKYFLLSEMLANEQSYLQWLFCAKSGTTVDEIAHGSKLIEQIYTDNLMNTNLKSAIANLKIPNLKQIERYDRCPFFYLDAKEGMKEKITTA